MKRTRVLARITAGTSLAALVLGSAMPSQAFRMIQPTTTGRVTSGNRVACNDPGGFAHWNTAYADWFLNTANQGAGKATALQNAMASWTNVPAANHVLAFEGTTSNGWATDSMNTILWATGNGCSGNCMALTALVIGPGHQIIESDITFNNDYTWRTDGSGNDTQAVATHELGHALGIHHTELNTTPTPTMAATYFGSGGRTLEVDDSSALVCSQNRYCVSPAGAPPVPASLKVTSLKSYGYSDLSWAAVPGATSYQLYRSSSPYFTNALLVYSGTATRFTINVSSKTYIGVRACNASGCSCFRKGVATYYPGCA